MPQANIPSEEEVLSYFDKFSNWGRWGDDDELGAPNLITPAKVRQAVGLVEEGVRISMARTISFEATVDAPGTAGPFHGGERRGLGQRPEGQQSRISPPRPTTSA